MPKVATAYREYRVDGINVTIKDVASPASLMTTLPTDRDGYDIAALRDAIETAGWLGKTSALQIFVQTETTGPNSIQINTVRRMLPREQTRFGASSDEPFSRLMDAAGYFWAKAPTNAPPQLAPHIQEAFEQDGPIESNHWGNNHVPYSWLGDFVRVVAETIARGIDVACAAMWGAALGAKRMVWPAAR